MGVRKKPSNLKLLDNARFQKKENEVDPTIEAPICPSHLSGGARREWYEIVPLLLELGLLTKIDKAALALYCQAFSDWNEFELLKQKVPPVYKNQRTGNIRPNPVLNLVDRARAQVHSYLIEFGLSPSSRSGMVVAQPTDVNDPYETWQKAKAKRIAKLMTNRKDKK